MSSPIEARFEFDALCEKAWQDEKGKMFVRAVASDDGLDLQRDRMSTKALQKMAESAKIGLPFLETHRSVFEFGKTTGGEIVAMKDKDGKTVNRFVVELELDGDYPQARKLFKEVASGNCKRQLSIGGKLNLKNRDAVSVEMTPSGLSRTIHDLELDHIASTREKQAANPRTSFTEAVAKALDAAEKDGWTGIEKEGVVTTKSDDEIGKDFLSLLGKTVRKFGGNPMLTNTQKLTKEGEGMPPVPPADAAAPEETTPPGEETTPATPDGMTPRNTDTPKTPKTPPEALAMAPGAEKGRLPTSAQLAQDIATLLSKSKSAPGNQVYNSLWTLRYVVAKDAGEAGAKITESGVFAPRDLSGAKPGVQDDKTKKGDPGDVGNSAVTDHRRNIHVGGEETSNAPTAKDALSMTMQSLSEHSKLPQVGEGDGFGKSLTNEALEKTMAGWLEKSTEVQKSLLMATVERLTEDREKDIVEVKKSVDQVGGLVNDAAKRLSEMEARIVRVEKSGGVSQSGARGVKDSSIPAPERKGGTWGGLFGKAASEALSRY
jgi:hypothetical protein